MQRLSTILLFLLIIFTATLPLMAEVRYHSPADRNKIEALIETASKGENIGRRTLLAAQRLIGIPAGNPADNDSIGTIMVRLDSIDRMALLNISIAAAQASLLTSPTIADFEKKLEGVSRRKGKDDGFASQFLYGSDWIVDNVYRGNVKEMTEYIESGNYKTKTLDRVSRNPGDYPSLADSTVLDKIKVMEMCYRSHRIPHLKKQSIGNKAILESLEDGDIIIMLPPDPDYDIYDIGIIEKKNNAPFLVHISRQTGEVTEEEFPLQRLFKVEGQHFYGFRWLRPVE